MGQKLYHPAFGVVGGRRPQLGPQVESIKVSWVVFNNMQENLALRCPVGKLSFLLHVHLFYNARCYRSRETAENHTFFSQRSAPTVGFGSAPRFDAKNTQFISKKHSAGQVPIWTPGPGQYPKVKRYSLCHHGG